MDYKVKKINHILDNLLEILQTKKLSFFLVFFVVITITYGFLVLIDFVPEAPTETDQPSVYGFLEDEVPTVTLEQRVNNGPWETSDVVTISTGDQIDLRWSSTSTESCVSTGFEVNNKTEGISNNITEPIAGNKTVYTILCTDRAGDEISDHITVTTKSVPVASPLADLSANPNPNSKPQRIIIDKLDIDVKVLNPNTLDISALDQALLSGVVRYPSSADFVEKGNIVIFGHSSYLPNVINKNFQAFNGVQNLNWGDRIRLQSADTEYYYRVEKIYQVKASEAVINNQENDPTLTIVTCNSFASTDDRYIVEAKLINQLPL